MNDGILRAAVDAVNELHREPLSLVFAIPDHPWVDAGDGAAVRIAMTVAAPGSLPGRLFTVSEERRGESEAEGRPVTLSGQVGKIFSNLRIGADVAGAKPLRANNGLSARGAFLIGKGFLLTRHEAEYLSQGTNAVAAGVVRPFLGGIDLTQKHRGRWVIDFWGSSEREAMHQYPALFQHVLDTVKPVRDQNDIVWRRENWWVFGDPGRSFRTATAGLDTAIVTSRTATHRIFQLWTTTDLPESEVVVVASNNAEVLANLSSRQHHVFSLASCGWMGVGNDPRYNNSICFDPFPFPDTTEAQKTRLRALGEELDAHRKAQQAAHPKLTLTAMYNVLEKLRVGERIEGRDKETYDQGLVGILRDIHDRIDAAVADAYGWGADLSDDDILHRLVDLNRARAAEEAQGLIRWLRPEYQNPVGTVTNARGQQAELDAGTVPDTDDKAAWPKTLPEQIAAVRSALSDLGEATPAQVARQFKRARASSVQPLLESLSALNQARSLDDGRFAI